MEASLGHRQDLKKRIWYHTSKRIMLEYIPNTHRFFVAPESIQGEQVHLSEAGLVHQLSSVLRLRSGARVLLLDNSGSEYLVELDQIERKQAFGHVIEQRQSGNETAVALTIYIALLRGERFELVLQKGTELGVQRFVPVQFARSLGGDRADEKKMERWRRILREAAEQSCRARIPELHAPLSFEKACLDAQGARAFLLYEGTSPPMRQILASSFAEAPPEQGYALFSGPEGGITPDEHSRASEHGIIAVSLGPRILRAETAPIAATAALLFALGDL